MTPEQPLSGKVAIVTGAGRGIGQAIARGLAEEIGRLVGRLTRHQGRHALVADLDEGVPHHRRRQRRHEFAGAGVRQEEVDEGATFGERQVLEGLHDIGGGDPVRPAGGPPAGGAGGETAPPARVGQGGGGCTRGSGGEPTVRPRGGFNSYLRARIVTPPRGCFPA